MKVEVGQIWEYRSGGKVIDVYLVVSTDKLSVYHLVDLRSLEQYPNATIRHSEDPDNSWWRLT